MTKKSQQILWGGFIVFCICLCTILSLKNNLETLYESGQKAISRTERHLQVQHRLITNLVNVSKKEFTQDHPSVQTLILAEQDLVRATSLPKKFGAVHQFHKKTEAFVRSMKKSLQKGSDFSKIYQTLQDSHDELRMEGKEYNQHAQLFNHYLQKKHYQLVNRFIKLHALSYLSLVQSENNPSLI